MIKIAFIPYYYIVTERGTDQSPLILLTHLVIAATPLFVGAAVRAEGYSGNIWSMNCWGV